MSDFLPHARTLVRRAISAPHGVLVLPTASGDVHAVVCPPTDSPGSSASVGVMHDGCLVWHATWGWEGRRQIYERVWFAHGDAATMTAAVAAVQEGCEVTA